MNNDPDLTALYRKQYETLTDRLAKMDAMREGDTVGALDRVSVKNRVEGENPMTRIEAGMNIGNVNSRSQIQSMQLQMEALDSLAKQLQAEQPTEDKMSEKDRLSLEIQAREKGFSLTTDENGRLVLEQSKTPEELKATKDKEETLSLVDEILGRDTGAVTGVPNVFKYLTGENQTTKNKIDQLKAKLSLDARQKLKGSGQISDYESKMLADSVSALRYNMSNADFKKELEKIRGILSGEGSTQSSSRVRVRLPDGQTGTVDASDFDPETMTKI